MTKLPGMMGMKQKTMMLACVTAMLGLAGCETMDEPGRPPEPTYEQALNKNLFTTTNYGAADELMRRFAAMQKNTKAGQPVFASSTVSAGAGQVESRLPLIVTTVVNIDQLEQSSTLGRLIAEQVASRLTQQGYGVVELKLRNSVYMRRNEGEFLLTREVKEVAASHQSQAVVVGTYAESANLIHVTLKVVNPANSLVLAAHDYALPLDRQVRSLLKRQASGY